MAKVKIQEIPYGGWSHCVQITNNIVDLVITVEVGPRIIRFGFVGQKNELCEVESTMGLTGGDEWRIYGGHRLWHSPESQPRTYEPDNSPVEWKEIPDGIRTSQAVEPRTGIKKEIEITLSTENTGVRILHRLINKGLWPIELSVWSITAMATGGKEIIPLTRKDTGLLPNQVIALWPYTRLNDPRIKFGEKYIIVQQDPNIKPPLKLGISNENGWASYFNHNHLFIKYYHHVKNAVYPDFGVSYETYTNDFMLEMETLSPLTGLAPGAYVEHIEYWHLFDNITLPEDEDEIEDILKDRVISPEKDTIQITRSG
jgi:hypothetical protein